MKLSMYILESWFKKAGYQTQSAINDGKMRLVGARIADDVTSDASVCISVKGDNYGLTSIANSKDVIFVLNASGEEVFNKTMEAFEYYNAWEASLLRAAFQRASLQEMLDEANLAIMRPMLIKSSRKEVCAITDSYGPQVHPLWGEYLKHKQSFPARVYDYGKGFNELQDVAVIRKPQVAFSPMYNGNFMFANLFMDDKRVGYINAYEHGRPFDQVDLQLMEVLQGIISFYVTASPEALFTRSEVEEYMASTLAGEAYHRHSLAELYKIADWDKDDQLVVILVQPRSGEAGGSFAELRDRMSAHLFPLFEAPEENRIVYLGNMKQLSVGGKPADLQSLMDYLEQNVDHRQFVWGVGHLLRGLPSFLSMVHSAELAVQYALETDKPGADIVSASIYIIGKETRQLPSVQNLLHPAYIRLTNYDRANGTSFAATLFWYLYYNRSLMSVASVMGVHRNTINNRILKIFEILEKDTFDVFQSRMLYLITYLTHTDKI